MRKIAACAIIGLLNFLSSTCYADAEWFYSDITSFGKQLIISPQHIIAAGQMAPLVVCPPDSKYFCFDGGGVQFAIPKQREDLQKWSLHGMKYEVKKKETLSLLGASLSVLVIEQIVKNKQLRFVYSDEKGLLIIMGAVANQPRRVFLLENLCGFPFDADCKH